MWFSLQTDKLPRVRFLGSISYVKPWCHFPRTADEYILYLVRSGTLYLREEGQTYELGAGDWLVLEPGRVHAGYREACCEYYFVHFQHDGLLPTELGQEEVRIRMLARRRESVMTDGLVEPTTRDLTTFLPKHCHIGHETLLTRLFHLQRESVEEFVHRYEDYRTIVSMRIQEMLLLAAREQLTASMRRKGSRGSLLHVKSQEVLDFIHHNYARKLTGADIEAHFDVAFDSLNRVFSKLTGHPVMHYLNLYRMNKARELIESSTLKLGEIGYLVGIEDPFHFSKLFRRMVGVTPSQYQAQVQGQR